MSALGHRHVRGVYDDDTVQLGRARVDRRERRLYVDGVPTDIGARAFEILLLLIEAEGRVVSHEEILARVWANRFVAENNLRVQIAALRRALGPERGVVRTVPDRGYAIAFHRRGHSEPAKVRPKARVSNPVIFVIDDEVDVREAVEGALVSAGMRVACFESVEKFLQSGRTSEFGVLVLDVKLPGRDGLNFQEDMIRAGIGLPIIFISGKANIPIAVQAMKAGAVEFLTKPIGRSELIGAVTRALASTS